MKLITTLSLLVTLTVNLPLSASETLIENVESVRQSNGNYQFAVTLRHADKSWDHYANFWQVQSEDGKVLGKRVLHHPHVNEQPFTRSLPTEFDELDVEFQRIAEGHEAVFRPEGSAGAVGGDQRGSGGGGDVGGHLSSSQAGGCHKKMR